MLSPGTMAQNADIRRPLRRAAQVGRRVLRWWLDELLHLIPSRVRQVRSADPNNAQICCDNGTDAQQVWMKGLSNVGICTGGAGHPRSALGVGCKAAAALGA
jgi:hypothetical protein